MYILYCTKRCGTDLTVDEVLCYVPSTWLSVLVTVLIFDVYSEQQNYSYVPGLTR